VIAGVAVLVAGAIVLPHVLRLDRAAPPVAIAFWASALALRALVVTLLTLWLALYVPHTPAFDVMTRWNVVLPLSAAHVEIDGHHVGDLTTSLPTFLVVVTAMLMLANVARAAFRVRRALDRARLGSGPHGSVVIGGSDVLVAAAGLGRPRVVVSAGALAALDDEELAASLAHERGHIVRRHRFLLAVGEVARGIASPVPWTRCAAAELRFHVERDADQWAVARGHEACALASAICKAAMARIEASASPSPRDGAPPLAALTGGGVTERVAQLVDGTAAAANARRSSCPLRATAAAAIALTLCIAALVPVTAVTGLQRLSDEAAIHHLP
jgi:beta-lactamase regulating signal transducer with metallopeptidase domain